MAKGSKTSIFVSSTCYDLNQVRADIYQFADSAGFEPVMSELSTFPVNPHKANFDNCLNAVRENADIFVLIVGGRYGTITGNGKSITNQEYLEARAKCIPIYVFIQSDILQTFKIWKKNPGADYSDHVDSNELFEFIETLYNANDTWIHTFITAQDIVETLKLNISNLLLECLELRKHFYPINETLLELSPKVLRIAVEKPMGWERLLTAQTLLDAVNQRHSKKLDIELGISLGEGIQLQEWKEILCWMDKQLNWIMKTTNQTVHTMNNGFIRAVGKAGEPGNLERIVHFSNRLGDMYEEILNWRLEFFNIEANDVFNKLLELLSNYADSWIKDFEQFVVPLYDNIEEVIKNRANYEKDTSITMTMTIRFAEDNHKEFRKELGRLDQLVKSGELIL